MKKATISVVTSLAIALLAGCSSQAEGGGMTPVFGQGGSSSQSGAGAGSCMPGDTTCQPPVGCEGPSCTCAAGLERVGDSCVTPLDNGTMMQTPVGGACTGDAMCGAGQACVGGTCQCTAGFTACGTSCANLMTDATNCGTCGVQCGGGVCNSGNCPAGKLCAKKVSVSTPVITDFEGYTAGTAADMWGFSFNAPPGQALTVYSGPYQFNDGTGSQTISMVTGNGSNYAVGISNASASAWGGGLGLWMGCIDASGYDGLAFDVRGNVPGGAASISLGMEQTSAPDAADPNAGGTCLEGCVSPITQFPVNNGWTRVLLPWSEFAPGSANQMSISASGNDITGLTFALALEWGEVAGAAGTYGPLAAGYELQIDNIGFFNTADLCAEGQQICDSQCIDPQSSDAHCGGCNNTCTGGSECAGAEQGCVCPPGLTFCAGSCVNLASDTSHCGECGNFCTIGATCNGGTCAGGNATTSNRCGETTRLLGNPFQCEFGWGANPDAAIPNFLTFASKWVGYEPNINTRCDGCTWLQSYGNLDVVPVYIAYITAYKANQEAGLGDCNLDFDGNNLCNGGAQYIRQNRARLIDMYASYAQRSYAVYPNRPVIWVIEPDLSQYAEGQAGNPFSMADLGGFAADIICAIKTNMPNAVIALNHSTWLSGNDTRAFWGAMPLDLVDMLHITSVANAPGGYFNTTDANNRVEGTFAFLSQLTGKPILADTSFGVTTMQDSWSTADAATLNQRIADGVIGALIYPTPGNYQQRINTLAPQLADTCQ